MAVLSYIITGPFGNYSSSEDVIITDVIITQDLNSMALTINDLPTGWTTYGTKLNTENAYKSNFIKIEALTPLVVYQNITRYPTVNDAKNEYLSQKGKITNFKVESVNLGNAGFGYVNTDSSIVFFRKGNIIVNTHYGEGGFLGGSSDLSISDAEDYAKIIANRIR